MKALLTYWIIGCALFGIGLGSSVVKCPHDEIKFGAAELIGTAMWPSWITGALMLPRGWKAPTECKTPSPAKAGSDAGER